MITVTAPESCAWTASSGAGWVNVSGSGTGNGSVNYDFDANQTTTSRVATINIADQSFQLTQSGINCTYSLDANSATFDSIGGTGSVAVTAPTGCSWTASSQADWLTISFSYNFV